jgi:broad specificity phosphatase PhoE
MIIYLVRHGQTHDNVVNKMQGWTDTPLNEIGYEQAKSLVPFLESAHIDLIYSSDLSRAYETARVIGESLKLNVFIDKQLREMYLGFWEGKSWQEMEAAYAYFFDKPEQERNAIAIHNGESYIEFQKRSFQSFKRLTLKHVGKTIVIVTHSGYIREVIAHILKLNQKEKDDIPIRNCSISQIEYDVITHQYLIKDICII